jgi:hypothetical protein
MLEFLGKTAKKILEIRDFGLGGAAHLARFSRNTEFMAGLALFTQHRRGVVGSAGESVE